MNKGLIWLLIIVVVLVGGWMLLGDKDDVPADDGQEPIKIGWIGPLTGDASSLGESARAAVALAVEEINTSGGVDDRMLEVIYEDGKCSGAAANNAAQKLINTDGVEVIIGGLCSAETSAFVPLSETSETPTISACSSAPALTQAGDYFFRVYPSDSFQGVFAAEYIKENIGANKAAVIYTNDDWGVGLQETFKNSFEGLGGTIVAVESFNKSDRDMRTQLSKIKTANPEAIYFLGFNEASIPGIRQAKELGINVPIVGGDAWDDDTIWSAVGDAGEGLRFTVVATPNSPDFVEKMQEKGNATTICAPQSYDIAYIYRDVMKEVGTNGQAVKNALYNVQNFQGVSGVISFDENGDLRTAGYVVKVVKDGVSAAEAE
jgi:branched-chain amino acid transport system substrate-binding protein